MSLSTTSQARDTPPACGTSCSKPPPQQCHILYHVMRTPAVRPTPYLHLRQQAAWLGKPPSRACTLSTGQWLLQGAQYQAAHTHVAVCPKQRCGGGSKSWGRLHRPYPRTTCVCYPTAKGSSGGALNEDAEDTATTLLLCTLCAAHWTCDWSTAGTPPLAHAQVLLA
jgi:hypothetical protein